MSTLIVVVTFIIAYIICYSKFFDQEKSSSNRILNSFIVAIILTAIFWATAYLMVHLEGHTNPYDRYG